MSNPNPPPIELAGCMVTNDEGHILLVHRTDSGDGQWELPAGRREDDEPLEVAAARRMYEELGIDVEILEQLGATDFEHAGKPYRCHWLRGSVQSGSPTIKFPELYDDVRYLSRAELETLPNLSENLRVALELMPQVTADSPA
ncbi:NUDIX hydrolase [Candidatus Berkelbacteria bacterium]|nr:NUDIX hydrolase [Candidatus Berkelbacteria bacterium]